MDKKTLYDEIIKAESIEDSMMNALITTLSFYIVKGFDFGLDEKSMGTLKVELDTMKRDTIKHLEMLKEIKRMLEEGVANDY